MATHERAPSEPNKTAPPGENVRQLLDQMNEELKELDVEMKKVDEEINKAEMKSKAVLGGLGL